MLKKHVILQQRLTMCEYMYRTLFGGDGFDDIKLVLGVEGDTDVIPPGFGIQCQSSFNALIVVVSDDLYNCEKRHVKYINVKLLID